MISVPVARPKNFRLPQRAKPTVLDQERSFLSRIVRQSGRRELAREAEVSVRQWRLK